MNKITRAIIMAAGKGTRMHPITETLPKPLIRVHGKRMIDTIIEALHENGIYEIYVVVGYLKEAFQNLPNEIKGITLIQNPYFDTCNNISSLYVAKDYISNAIIIDGDQIVTDSTILSSEFENSGYNCVWQENDSKEWMLTLDDHYKVLSCSRIGGNHAWQLYGISRWTKEDGIKLKELLELEFKEKKNTQIYWDDIAMFEHFDEFNLQGYPMHAGGVKEIDSLDELIEEDSSYCCYKGE